MSPAEVAAALGRGEAWFRRMHGRLSRFEKFPRPLPGCGLVWSTVQVTAWIKGGGRAAAVAAANDPLATIREHLETRHG